MAPHHHPEAEFFAAPPINYSQAYYYEISNVWWTRFFMPSWLLHLIAPKSARQVAELASQKHRRYIAHYRLSQQIYGVPTAPPAVGPPATEGEVEQLLYEQPLPSLQHYQFYELFNSIEFEETSIGKVRDSIGAKLEAQAAEKYQQLVKFHQNGRRRYLRAALKR